MKQPEVRTYSLSGVCSVVHIFTVVITFLVITLLFLYRELKQ